MNIEADLSYTSLFWRIHQRFSQVDFFRRTTNESLPYTRDLIQQESHIFAQVLAYDNQLDDIFIDKAGFFDIFGGVEKFASEHAKIQLSTYQASIDATSIVLSHSTLDSTAFDCLSIIQMVAPIGDWERFLNKRQVTLEELKESSPEVYGRSRSENMLMIWKDCLC